MSVFDRVYQKDKGWHEPEDTEYMNVLIYAAAYTHIFLFIFSSTTVDICMLYVHGIFFPTDYVFCCLPHKFQYST